MSVDSELCTLKACRACGGVDLAEFLHYEQLAIAGTYLKEPDLGHETLLPLTGVWCNDCKLVRLREVLPRTVYTSYRFSGTGSLSYRAHLDWVTESLGHSMVCS